MVRILVGLFLIAHGLVHALYWECSKLNPCDLTVPMDRLTIR